MKLSDGQLRRPADGVITPALIHPCCVGMQVGDESTFSCHRFTSDEEIRFLKGVDADKKEALRRLHITAVRVWSGMVCSGFCSGLGPCIGRTCMSTAPHSPCKLLEWFLVTISNALKDRRQAAGNLHPPDQLQLLSAYVSSLQQLVHAAQN